MCSATQDILPSTSEEVIGPEGPGSGLLNPADDASTNSGGRTSRLPALYRRTRIGQRVDGNHPAGLTASA
jgi:hypothetical protein